LSTTSQRFQTIVARLRPHRVAVLIDASDTDWQRSCLRIIEYFSQVWGGAHSLIIPTDGNMIDDCFWELLSAFDPDLIYRYQKTGYDLFVAGDPAYLGYVERQIAQAVKEGASPDSAERIREDLNHSPLDESFVISEELKSQLLNRLAPFHIDEHFHINYISAQDKPGFPLTFLGDIFPALPHPPDHITELLNNAPDQDRPPSLWLLSECGAATKAYTDQLAQDCNIQVASHPMLTLTERELINLGVNPGAFFSGGSPYALSRTGLKGVKSSSFRSYASPSALVVGDSLKDFCLAYCLSRLHGRSCWLPEWFMPTEGKFPARLTTLVSMMHQRARRENNNHFALMSMSKPASDLHPLVDAIRNKVSMVSSAVEDATNGQTIRNLVAHPLIWYISGSVEQITTQMVIDDRLPGTFESPSPSIFTQINPQSHRWIVELSYLDRMTPRHPALGTTLIYGPNVGDVRAATNGATYQCPGFAIMGNDMEFQVLRPSVNMPDAEAIFRVVLDHAGYVCKVSDKGAYTQASIDKFGGLEQAGMEVRHPSLLALLQKYLDTTRPAKGVFDEGVLLRDRRRYLNFACMAKILKDADFTKRTIDEWVGKGILYRGFIFKCSRCSDCAWFSVEELAQTFKCRRCGTVQQYVQASWNCPDEPSWFYKLDEIVFHMITHDGHVDILALDKLRRDSKRDFQFASELQIRHKDSDDWEMEIDICAISAGRLLIGEAKSNDSLKTNRRSPAIVAERYRTLAEAMNASGVVFATYADGWDSTSLTAMDTEFAKNPYLRLTRLGNQNLTRVTP
jgi:hypothetical protein